MMYYFHNILVGDELYSIALRLIDLSVCSIYNVFPSSCCFFAPIHVNVIFCYFTTNLFTIAKVARPVGVSTVLPTFAANNGDSTIFYPRQETFITCLFVGKKSSVAKSFYTSSTVFSKFAGCMKRAFEIVEAIIIIHQFTQFITTGQFAAILSDSLFIRLYCSS